MRRTSHNKRLWLLVLLLLSALTYALFLGPENFLSQTWHGLWSHRGISGKAGPEQAATPAPSHGPAEEALPTDPIRRFDQLHAPYVDTRIVQGLTSAFKEYARLFPVASDPETSVLPEVTYTIAQRNGQEYRITYTVAFGPRHQAYDIILSTRGSRVLENLHAASRTLEQFSGDFSGSVRPAASIQRFTSEAAGKVDRFIEMFDDNDLFEAIKIIEDQIAHDRLDPELLFKASEIFAWLAFFKETNSTNDLVNKLAVQSVSNFLLADLFSNSTQRTSRYYGAVLLLVLHYENESRKLLETVEQAKHPKAMILSSYLQVRLDTLDGLSTRRGSNTLLIRYLLARAYDATGQDKQAHKQLLTLIDDYPDFLTAKEFLADIGTVGLSRTYAEPLLDDTLENDLHFVRDFFETDWIRSDSELEFAASTEVNGYNRLGKWIRIHKRIVDNSRTLKSRGTVLSPTLLKDFLRESLLNRLYLYYKLYAVRLSKLANASAVLDLVQQNYPDSDTARGMKIHLLMEYEKYIEVKHYVETIDKTSAGAFLLRNLLRIYAAWPDWKRWPKIVDALEEYRRKENPDSKGSLSLSYYYRKFYDRPRAMSYLKRSKDLNPYRHRVYIKLAAYGDTGDPLREGEAYFRNCYDFQLKAAHWYKSHQQLDKAIACYTRAISLSPEDNYAYKYLGDTYEEQGRFEDAVRTWQDYLKIDNDSLKAVHIKNRIGNLYLDRGEYQKAYDIFKEGKESYQNSALQGFARACEKLHKPLQAEQYFRKAAERYPNGSAPVALGLFYLRQGNEKTACRIFKEYERYNHISYYFSELIDDSNESGEPGKAISLVREVHRKEAKLYYLELLAQAYARKGFHAIAAELYQELAHSKDRVGPGQRIRCAAALFDEAVQAAPEARDKAFEEALAAVGDNIGFVIAFGIKLISMEYYEEAYRVFEQVYQGGAPDNHVTLLMMSIAWRGGDQRPGRKKDILAALESSHVRGWYHHVISYLLGDRDETSIFHEADNRNKICEIHYYAGLIRSMEGRKDEAVTHLLISLETKATRNLEYRYAHEKLKKLASAS